MMHKNLVNRFDYDGDYGTVLNRFIVQSVVRHPLTVYGEGGQTRAFINMRDTVKCVRLAVESPPTRERVRIMNQVAEEHTVLSLAKLVAKLTGAEIRLYTNPRQEAAHNNLKLKNELLKKMGLNPILLENSLIMEIRNVVEQNKDRIDPTKVITTSMWTKNNKVDRVGRKHEEYDEELEVPAKIIRKAQP
jgi:UDP-sulfoquinovose synthase